MQPLITILGPTASGKSDLAIQLAGQFGGEIISADSRQIYRGFDIGSGKITPEQAQIIPHHMLNIRDIWQDFNVSEFQAEANQIIHNLGEQNKLPFLVGGTGLYIESIIHNYSFSPIEPNKELREKLSQHTKEELQKELLSLNPNHNLNYSDWNNPIRLIRAIEIANSPRESASTYINSPQYNTCIIGLNNSLPNIKKKIAKRVDNRLEAGVIEEVKILIDILNTHLDKSVSKIKLQQLGLGTIAIAKYIDNVINYEEMRRQYIDSEYQYARRQLTWFRRIPNIHWFEADNPTLMKDSNKLISVFVQSLI
jgi:tRNA dimethylallyltransferase